MGWDWTPEGLQITITRILWAAKPVYGLVLEISSYYWANKTSTGSKSPWQSAARWTRLHSALIQGTLWSVLQAVNHVSATHTCPRRKLFFPWDAVFLTVGRGKDGMRYQEAAKMEDDKVRGQAKRKLNQQRKPAKSELLFPFPLPSATLPAAFSFTFSSQGTRRIVEKGLPWKGRSQLLISSYSSSPFSLISVFNLALLVAFGICDRLKS